MAFVVAMLVLNCALLTAGGILAVFGDRALIEAAGRAAGMVAPAMAAATAMLAVVQGSARLKR